MPVADFEYHYESLEVLKNTFNEETAKKIIRLITIDKGTYAFLSHGTLDVYTEYMLLWGGFNEANPTNTTQARARVFALMDQFSMEFYEEDDSVFVGPPYNVGFKKLNLLYVRHIQKELSVLSKQSIEHYISNDYDALVKSFACTESCETWNLTKWHNEKRMLPEALRRDDEVVLLQHLKARIKDNKKSKIIYDEIMERTVPLDELADLMRLQGFIRRVDLGYYDNYPNLTSVTTSSGTEAAVDKDTLLFSLMLMVPVLLLLYLINKFVRPCDDRCTSRNENPGAHLPRLNFFSHTAARVALQSGGTVIYSRVDDSDEDGLSPGRSSRLGRLG